MLLLTEWIMKSVHLLFRLTRYFYNFIMKQVNHIRGYLSHWHQITLSIAAHEKVNKHFISSEIQKSKFFQFVNFNKDNGNMTDNNTWSSSTIKTSAKSQVHTHHMQKELPMPPLASLTASLGFKILILNFVSYQNIAKPYISLRTNNTIYVSS